MAFSFDEWKKKDNGRAKPKTGAGNFDDWKAKRTPTGIDKNDGTVRTFDNHLAAKEIDKITKTKELNRSFYVPPEVERQVDRSRFVKENKAEEHSFYVPPGMKVTPKSSTKYEPVHKVKNESVKEKKKEEKASLMSRMLGNAITIGPDSPVRGMFNKDNDNDTLGEKFGANLRVGSGDVLEGLAGVGRWLLPSGGKIDKDTGKIVKTDPLLSRGLQGAANKLKDGFEDEGYNKGKDFNFKKAITDPEFYATSVTRAVPQLITSIVPALGAAKLVGMIPKIKKAKTVHQTIFKALGGAGAATTIDSAIESGSVFDEAIRRGYTEDDANKAANETFMKNFALTGGTTFGEFMLGLSPIGRGVKNIGKVGSIAARTAGGAGLEGFQEGAQTGISASALGDDFSWTDPSTIEAMTIGTLLGGGVTGGMAVVTEGFTKAPKIENPLSDIITRTANQLPSDLRQEFDNGVNLLQQNGFELADAQETMMEKMAVSNPAIVALLDGSTQSYVADQRLSQQARVDVGVATDGTVTEVQAENAVNPIAETVSSVMGGVPNTAQQMQRTVPEVQNPMPLTDNAVPTLEPVAQLEHLSVNPELINNAPQEVVQAPQVDVAPQADINTQQAPIQQSAKSKKAPAIDTSSLTDGDQVRLRGTKAESILEVVDSSSDTDVTVRNENGREYSVERNAIEEVQPSSPIEENSLQTIEQTAETQEATTNVSQLAKGAIVKVGNATMEVISDSGDGNVSVRQVNGSGKARTIKKSDIKEVVQNNSSETVATGNVKGRAIEELEAANGDPATAYQNVQNKVDAMEDTLIAKYGEDAFFGADLKSPPGTSENPFTQEETNAFNELVNVRDTIEHNESDAGIESIMANLTEFPVASKAMVERALRDIQYDIQLDAKHKVDPNEQGKVEDIIINLYNSLSDQLQGTKNALPEPLFKEFEQAVDAALDFENSGIGKSPIEFLLQIDHIMDQGLGVDISTAIPDYVELRSKSTNDPKIVEEEEELTAELPAPTKVVEESPTSEIVDEELTPETEVQDEPLPSKETLNGNAGETFTEKGTKIEFVYQLVEANELITSNNTDMSVNENYPQELQPRDRSRKASQEQVRNIAQKLNPELLGESAKASDGAPIVGEDMVVESGNGRTIALKSVYEKHMKEEPMYRGFLVSNAEKFGFTKDEVANFNNPVLVRVRTNEVNRSEFAAEANESNVAAMSATEQAKTDSTKLTNRVMHLFSPADNGDLNVSANRAFITAFIGEVTAKNDRGSLLTSDGNLSQEGLQRVRNAVFAKAYGDLNAISLVSESTDNNVATVTSAMLKSAPRFAVMKDKISSGNLHDLDITTEIVEAMTQLTQLRSEGTSIKTHIDQTSMFDEMSDLAKDMLIIYDSKEFKRSTKKLGELFNQYVDILEVAGDPKQESMFENITPTKAEILEVAMKRVTTSEQANTQTNLFQDTREGINETRAISEPKKQRTKNKNRDITVDGQKLKSPASYKANELQEAVENLTFEEQNFTEDKGTYNKYMKLMEKEFNKRENSSTDTFIRTRERTSADPSRNISDDVDTNNSDTTVTRAEIINYIKDKFDTTIGIGKTRGNKGIYKNKFAIIRSANYADFEVLAHELGHRIDTKLQLSVNPEIREELIKFAESNLELPDSMTPLKRAREGAAEYFRQVFYNETQANTSIKDVSDKLTATVNEGLEKAGWTNPTKVLQEMTTSWMNRTAEQELAGIVTPIGSSRRQKRSTKRWMMDIYTSLFEKEHPLWVAEQMIEKELKKKGLELPVNAKAYVMSVMTRGTAARAVQFTKFNTFKTDFNRTNEEFQITGEPLEAILKDVEDSEKFGHYLVAKHAYHLKTKKGKSNTPITEEKIAEYLAYADPKIEALAKRIYDYQNRLLDVLVDGGLIDSDLPATLKEEYPFYVPFYRDMSETGSDGSAFGGSSDGFANQQQGVKKMSEKGSSRNIINPIESIVKNTHLYFALADRNSVGVAMASWADPDSDIATEVARDLIEEIPNSYQVTEVALEQLHKTLLDAGIEQDILDGVDMAETTKIFSPLFKPNSARNEVLVWADGKPKLYMVRDNSLYNAIVAQDNQMFNAIMNFPLTKVAVASNKALRFGITASPFFTIRTFVRSVFQMTIKTHATMRSGNYFLQFPMIGKAMSDVVSRNNLYQEWMASGGGQSTMIALEQNYLDRSLEGIALNKKAKNLLKGKYQHESNKDLFKLMTYMGKTAALSPLRGLQSFNDTLDQALKLSEYKVVKKQTGGNIQQATRSSRDADLDYGRFGSPFMRGMNSMTLFWNISFQGIDNVAREFGNYPVRMTARGLLTVTLPTLLLYLANYDDEDYHELNSYEKDMNWMIKLPDGTFAKIPIPFELGILFKALPEKFFGEMMDTATGQDKQNWRDFRKNISKTLAPSLTPTIWDVSGKYKAEKDTMNDWAFVPPYLQGVAVEDQYDENTSEAMKWLGKRLKKSPMVLEATFNAQFAQAGQAGLYFADSMLDAAGVVERPDTKGLKRSYLERYVSSSIDDGSTDSVSTYYDEKDRLTKLKEPTDQEENLLDSFKKANTDLVSLRKVRDGMLYDRLLQPDGTKFPKEEKKVQIDIVNKALRDITRLVQGKKPLDEANLEMAWTMIDDYTAFDKAVKKKERAEKKAKKEAQLQIK